jgi:hypothetical protein
MTKRPKSRLSKNRRSKRLGRERRLAQAARRTGEELADVMRASPLRDIDIEPWRGPLPVRDVKL